jgi:Ca-activated chloride channel family protein
MQADDPGRAAELFVDPQWRATAEYRSADYTASAATLSAVETVEAHYNRGNALARAGELEPAVEAYEQAIALKPDHEDAIYNRDLLKELLEQQQEQQQQQQQQTQDQQSQGGAEQQDGGEQGEQNAQNQNGEPQDQEPGEQPAQTEPDANEQQGEPEQQQAQAEPQDVEEWASDQAAEQWLRRIPQDPGGLLRRKFLYQYQRLGVDQDGNYVWPGDEKRPW